MTMDIQAHILLSLVQGGGNGDDWSSKQTGWKSNEQPPVPVCEWSGILCDPSDDATVIEIALEETGLQATLPPELGNLLGLRALILRKNALGGSIPDEVAALPQLELVDLSVNSISGTLPTFSSPKLREVFLGENQIRGSIPSDFGSGHESLIELDVDHNSLTGSLPQSLGLLTNLNRLALADNAIYGVLPSSLTRLESLQFLHLERNALIGTVSSDLSAMLSLSELSLQGNVLSGSLPLELAELPSLTKLGLHGNKFTGTVPGDFCTSSVVNSGFGEAVDDSRDCSQIACPVGTASTNGVGPCDSCPPGLWNSPYLGHAGTCLSLTQLELIREFWDGTGGKQWTRDNNWFYDGTTPCDFTGIGCNEESEIISIELSGFGLVGPLPALIGYLPTLQSLDLSNNRLTGYIPSDLRLAPLVHLDLSGNQFVGQVPPLLCRTAINGNGEGGDVQSCDKIVCPMGTFNEEGRATAGSSCLPCYDDDASVGATTCLSTYSGPTSKMPHIATAVVVLCGIAIVTLLAMLVARYLKFSSRMRTARSYDLTEDGFAPNEDPGEDPLMTTDFNDDEQDEPKEKDILTMTRRESNDKDGWQTDWKSEKESSNEVWLDVPRIT